ncbi:Rubisco large subunit N-methyltransferase [Volvox carteri f. nagariensis]|uniref:Rubisco large subunit N-methyltransferase n=1 Tax=Volvox carteri f. nagariensis TaxID=3068 RepID=D8TTN7_VOLCA|nr:Rubisco large subunit N-methyltransferase [Volvox carteri f. nagariensis]EFJ49228.1 Rubisco large subunit N-methyltransferase [Volvox carteri f. nagariensis]|eukprot:XP_002949676.1 Rubisco large subunit N-methyltransferase [Volvox carteri f. nagariensis]
MQQALKAHASNWQAGLRRASSKRPTRLYCRAASAVLSSIPADAAVSWATSKGAKLERASLSNDLQTDRPVLIASTDAQQGDVLFSVPDSAWLSAESVKKAAVGKLAAAAGLEPWLQIALQLVADRFGSTKSELSAYAASIPEDLDTPLLWSEDELQELQGTQVLQTLGGYLTFFRSTFQQLQSGLFTSNPAAFPPSIFTLPRFLWAVAAVRSRSHPPLDGPKIALAPLTELVSHRRAANSKLSVRSAGLFGRGQVLVLEATRAIRKGEPLSMDYGPGKLDGPVLVDYGVMDVTSPKPGYSLTLKMPDSDRFIDDKLDILESNDLPQSVVYNLTPDEQPTIEMLAFLRLMQLKGSDAFLLESIFRNDVWGFMQEPVSEGNEEAVCNTLSEGARAALGGYGTTIDQDLAELRAQGSRAKGSRREAALLIRLGEKEALDAVARFFEDRRATQLKRLVYYQERRLRRLGLVDDEGRTTYDSFFKDGIA